MSADVHHRPARWLVPAIYCGSAAAFAVDMTTVNLLPVGICYVPLVGSAVCWADSRSIWRLAAIACAMVFVGSFSPSIDPDVFTLTVNRAVSVGALLGTAAVVHYTRHRQELYRSDTISPVLWERSGEAYYATVAKLSGEIRFFLAAEAAGQAWHWIAWRPGSDELTAPRGQAPTVQQAMRDAERAAAAR